MSVSVIEPKCIYTYVNNVNCLQIHHCTAISKFHVMVLNTYICQVESGRSGIVLIRRDKNTETLKRGDDTVYKIAITNMKINNNNDNE